MSLGRIRFRSRITPLPKADVPIKWGTYFVGPYPDGPWVPFQTLTGPIGLPYLKAESCMDELHEGPPFKSGGPFRKITIECARPGGLSGHGTYITNWDTTISGFGFGRVKYVGAFGLPDTFPGTSVDVINISGPQSILGINSPIVPDLGTLSNTVWDRSKPKLEQGGLAVAIAELRDVPQMMKTSAKGFHDIWKSVGGSQSSRILSPKKAADHFLNHNFGWVPFVKDLTAFCDNVINVDSKIERLMAGNGKYTRRRVTLVNQTRDILLGGDQFSLVYPTNTVYLLGSMTANPSYEVWERKEAHAHSVGAFTYYQPYLDASSPSSVGALAALRRQLLLHGARISPANVYKAVPWTWLIDWVSDTGRFIGAVQDAALDGLAAKYLFLTHRETKTITIKQTLPFNSISGGPKTLEYSRVFDVKQRKEAESPFGFGLHPENLSPKQLAILAALGITRY